MITSGRNERSSARVCDEVVAPEAVAVLVVETRAALGDCWSPRREDAPAVDLERERRRVERVARAAGRPSARTRASANGRPSGSARSTPIGSDQRHGQVEPLRVLEHGRDVLRRPHLRPLDVAEQVEPRDVVVVVMRRRRLDPLDAVVAPQRSSDQSGSALDAVAGVPVRGRSRSRCRARRRSPRGARSCSRSVVRLRSRCGVISSNGLREPVLHVPAARRAAARSAPRSARGRRQRALHGPRSARRATAAARPGRAPRARAHETIVAAWPSMPLYDHCVAASDHTLPSPWTRSPVNASRRPSELDEVGDRAGRVARRRQRVDVDAAVASRSGTRRRRRRPAPTRAARSGPRAGRSRCRSVRRRQCSSTLGDELGARAAAPRRGCPASTARREPADLVAVVMRDEDVRHPVDPELVEVVEHVAVPKSISIASRPDRST